MIIKKDNRDIYIKVLKNMSYEEKLLKCFELSEYSKKLLIAGIKNKYPDINDNDLNNKFLEILNKCHNRKY